MPKRYRVAKPQARRGPIFSGWRRLLLPIAFLGWLGSVPGDLLERAAENIARGVRRPFRGRVWQGGWDSDAGRLAIAVRNGPTDRTSHDHDDAVLAFTRHRLLVLSRPASPERERAHLLVEFPRTAFARHRAPHPARHRKRADIAFADGSWLALKAKRSDHAGPLADLLG
ncbi:hypothetical protein ACFV3R_31825 [Streptomyces sp. NPDC059740]|uniref:hypothetical protein n=1 Tax=Streptomyces sp. NPDC059740 TaxID=3346926 RepID=UPI00366839DC